MPNNKLLILALKGFGDAVIVANMLRHIDSNNFHILTIGRNLSLIKLLLNSDENISRIIEIDQIPKIYNIKKNIFHIFRLLCEIFIIRSYVKKYIKKGYFPLIDINSLKNRIIFYGLNPYFLADSNNIYESYQSFFSIPSNLPVEAGLNGNKFILILPYGSTQDRCIPPYYLEMLYNFLSDNSIKYKVLIHKSQKLIHEANDYLLIYNDFSELIQEIKNARLLITVDSIGLHLGEFYMIPSCVCSNSWNFFLPSRILKKDLKFPINNPEPLISFLFRYYLP